MLVTMAATAVSLRDALSKILGRGELDVGGAHAGSRSPPAPPPSPSLQQSSEFEFEKLFNSPGSDHMESEPGSPSMPERDLSLSCESSYNSLTVPPYCSHLAHLSNQHGNGLSSCIQQIARQTELLSVSLPTNSRHVHLDRHGPSAASLGMSGMPPNTASMEERLLEADLAPGNRRVRKISLKRNHDDISMDDCCYTSDSDQSWLIIEVDPMEVGGNKKSCQERTCGQGNSKHSPKHSRRSTHFGSSVPLTSDFAHDHVTSQASAQVGVVTSSGPCPHWPNGFSHPRVISSGQVPVCSMGMSTASVTKTTVGFDDQQMDCQDEETQPHIPVATQVDNMEFESSLTQSTTTPFSFNTGIPPASSAVHPEGSQPFTSFRPHAHSISAGFQTCTNISSSPHSPSVSSSGLMNVGMSHLGVPQHNLVVPRAQQFDFFSFHEPSGNDLASNPQDSFSKSL